MRIIFTIVIVFIFSVTSVISQSLSGQASESYKGALADSSRMANLSWAEMMSDQSINFYAVRDAFNQFWAGRTPGKGKGYKPFRRWEAMMAPRVYPTGQRLVTDAEIMKRFKEFEQQYSAQRNSGKSLTGTWSALGSNGAPSGSPSNQPGGTGRVNCIAFNPLNTNIMYIGAPSAGLWRSNNGGSSWNPVNDTFAVVGVSSVVINHLDTSVMYIATGDGDAGDTYTVGIMKSTNSGQSWHYTSFHPSVQSGYLIRKLVMHPTNPDIMWAATNGGILKTTDGWASYTVASGIGGTFDIELKPGDPSTLYASTYTAFYKSTDGGTTFTAVTLPTPPASGFLRIAIAVSAAAPNNVYVVCGRNDASPYTNYAGFGGFYTSTNSGGSFTETFNETSSNHNLLGWSPTFSDQGGQSWYDLDITVNPGNANEIYIGGVNIAKSTNGGANWSCNAYWMTGYGYPYSHADHHAFAWLPNSTSTLFNGNDGGIFKTTNNGSTWTDISGNLCINQLWGMGISTTNSNLIMTGWQDNGVNKLLSGAWTHIRGGDGMEVMCTPGNDSRVFGSYAYGDFYLSSNGGSTWSTITPSAAGDGEWVTPIVMDPNSTTKIYTGYTTVYYNGNATPSTTNWTTKGTVGGTGNIIRMALAPSASTTTMYVIKSSGVYKTTNLSNATPTWTDVTGNLPVSSAMLSYIAVDQTDANRVYVTFSGYVDGTKVYMSTTGGTTWTDISNNLPNLPMNCVVIDKNSADHAMYVGGDVGVYYKDDNSQTWILFSDGLPNVVVKELEIYYGASQTAHRLRAGTYGRGVWESDLYEPPTVAPSCEFKADKTYACTGSTIQFTDLSLYIPTSWSWTFTGGTPSTSNSQNPAVVYNTPGTYQVSLTVTNANGSDTETKTAYITIGPYSTPFMEEFGSSLFAPADWTLSGAEWKRANSTGALGTATTSALFECYYFSSGTTGDLISPSVNLSSLGANPVLNFNVSYRQYSSETDRLQVFISTDCGSTWTSLYDKSGSTLSTGTATTAYWRPAAAGDWRQETISLSSYASQSVMLKFTGTSDYGNNIWIDDVEMTTAACTIGDAGSMSGTSPVCQGQTGVIYSIAAVTGATTYEWSVPSGAAIVSGNGTNSITVDFSNSASSGYISVKPKNSCGYGASSSGGVVVNQLPGTPDEIFGASSVCQGQNNVLFYVPEIWNYLTDQDGYVWTLPTGASIVSGDNTDSIYVNFSTSAVSGNISVHGNNSCGNGPESPLFAITVNPVPEQPSVITGNVLPCQGVTGLTYSVTQVPGVTYNWSVPTGWTITAGQGTNSIIVTSGNASGIIQVIPSNACGNGTAQTLTVEVLALPGQPSVIVGETTPCQGSSQIYSVNAVTGVSYAWSFPAGWSQTGGGTSNAVTAAVGISGGTITVTPSNACGLGMAQTLLVGISTAPSQPSVVSGETSPCQGATGLIYSVTNESGVTYNWTLPSGWIQTAGGNTNSITVTAATSGGTITVTPSNVCGSGSARTFAVSISSVPAQPSAVSGTTSPCQGTTGLIYSVINEPGVTYNWTLPLGWTQTAGGNTNSVTVTAGTTGGTITVTPSNTCGSGSVQSLVVSITPGPSITGQPLSSTIGVGGNTSFNVTASGAGLTYQWQVSTDGGATYNNIVAAGSNPTYADWTTATLSLTGVGAGNSGYYYRCIVSGTCAPSATSTGALLTVDGSPAITSHPTSVSICDGNNTLFSVTASGSGLSYQWQVSTDDGVSFNDIISAGSNPVYSGWATNTLSLTAVDVLNNGYLYRCIVDNGVPPVATSNAATLTVNDVPVQPSAITGVTSTCQNISGLVYSVSNVAGITYTWSVPSGWVITAGQGSSSITVTSGTLGGNISVIPSNGCGTGTAQVLAVSMSAGPDQPAAINGNASPCENESGLVYSVTNVAGLSYTWTLPSGWIIISGQGSNSITADAGSVGGTITVTPSNACGDGIPQAMSVSIAPLPDQPSVIAGNSAPCSGTNGLTFSVVNESGMTYNWTVPSGWIIESGQGSNSITVTAGAVSGYISVTPSNACGSGISQTLLVIPGSAPSQPSLISGDVAPCSGMPGIVYSVANVAGISYNWNVPAGWTITAGQNTNSVTVNAGTSGGSVSVTPSNACGTGPAQTLTVTVGAIPAQPMISGNIAPCIGSTETYSVTAVAGEIYNWTVPTGSTITAGQGTSTITVTIGSINGNVTVVPQNTCGLGVYQNLAIMPAEQVTPGIDIGTVPGVCDGTSVSFIPSVVNGGPNPVINWFVNGAMVGTGSVYTLISPVDGDVVYAILNSDASCTTTSSVQSGNSLVMVFDLPAAPVITQSNDTLFSSYTHGNQWYITTLGMIPGAMDYFFVPAVNGDYYVVHVDSNGCISTPSAVLNYVIDFIGDESFLVSVYPNPSGNVFNISFSALPVNGIRVMVIDAVGAVVHESLPSKPVFSIDLGNHADGIYFMNVMSGNETITIKLIKGN
ncbi:MAG: PKD domain-containing protein [Bacteroidales bacterium]